MSYIQLSLTQLVTLNMAATSESSQNSSSEEEQHYIRLLHPHLNGKHFYLAGDHSSLMFLKPNHVEVMAPSFQTPSVLLHRKVHLMQQKVTHGPHLEIDSPLNGHMSTMLSSRHLQNRLVAALNYGRPLCSKLAQRIRFLGNRPRSFMQQLIQFKPAAHYGQYTCFNTMVRNLLVLSWPG